MSAWLQRHASGVIAWMVIISWVVHLNLLYGAAARGDELARNWEIGIIIVHHLAMLGLLLSPLWRRRKHETF